MALTTVCTGFEFGTTAGWTTGNSSNKIIDTATSGCTITTTNPRTGTYCLNVAASSSSQGIEWTTATLGSGQNRIRAVFSIRLNSSTGNPTLAVIDSNTSAFFGRDGTSGNFFAQIETGSIVQGPTFSLNTTYVVELYYDISGSTYTLDWSIDGSAQTQLTLSSTAGTITGGFALGFPFSSQTFNANYDDVLIKCDTSAIAALGTHKVVLLSVDPADTITLSGTTTNFNTFTANGTLAAWNATTARNNIDEIPPTIGASADGFVQVTAATSDFVNIPMTSYTIAGGESISAIRMLAPGWATSTTACTIGFRSFNGTTETILQDGTVDPNFDNSTTNPAWVCKMLTLTQFDSQSEIDALAFRVGFSSDSTPDIGIHAIYAEVAVKEAVGGADQNVAGNGIPSSEAIGNSLVAQVISVGAIPSTETVGSPTITTTYTINANGIPSNEKLGSPAVTTTHTVNANGITSSEFVSSPAVAQGITANSIQSSEFVGQPAITTTYTINANGISTSELFGNSNIAAASSVTPTGIPSAEQVGQPAVSATYTINATGIPSGSAFGNASVGPAITPTGITSNEAFGTQSISVIVAINATGIVSTEQFGSATVSATYTISATGIPSASQFGNSNVASVSTIAPSSITSTEQFGRPAITPGPVTVAPTGIPSAGQFGNAIASLGLLSFNIFPTSIPSESRFGSSTFVGPEIDDAIIWRAEGNVIYVADEALPVKNVIDDVVSASDEAVDVFVGPDLV